MNDSAQPPAATIKRRPCLAHQSITALLLADTCCKAPRSSLTSAGLMQAKARVVEGIRLGCWRDLVFGIMIKSRNCYPTKAGFRVWTGGVAKIHVGCGQREHGVVLEGDLCYKSRGRGLQTRSARTLASTTGVHRRASRRARGRRMRKRLLGLEICRSADFFAPERQDVLAAGSLEAETQRLRNCSWTSATFQRCSSSCGRSSSKTSLEAGERELSLSQPFEPVLMRRLRHSLQTSK